MFTLIKRIRNLPGIEHIFFLGSRADMLPWVTTCIEWAAATTTTTFETCIVMVYRLPVCHEHATDEDDSATRVLVWLLQPLTNVAAAAVADGAGAGAVGCC